MALMVFLLAACGGGGSTSGETSEESSAAENSLAGKTYEYVSMQVDGNDVEIPEGLKGRKLTFNDDGTFLLAGYRSEEGKYTVKDMTGTYKSTPSYYVAAKFSSTAFWVFIQPSLPRCRTS